MKKIIYVLSALFLLAIPACAKKVTVTIDGTTSPSQTSLYLIINEDTAHAQRIPIQDSHFSVKVKVDRDAFIRLHDYKGWPERSVFVLIPDSRHITIDWRNGTIEGSPMSQKLQTAIKDVKRNSPEGFHIDVFSDDPALLAEARERARNTREIMLREQMNTLEQVIQENKDNNIPAWLIFCYYPQLRNSPFQYIAEGHREKWTQHPLLKLLKKD